MLALGLIRYRFLLEIIHENLRFVVEIFTLTVGAPGSDRIERLALTIDLAQFSLHAPVQRHNGRRLFFPSGINGRG